MASTSSLIRLLTPKIQQLVDLRFGSLTGEPESNLSLDQAGLRQGDQIIYEFLDHGEHGLAFEHLVYMIEEAGIALAPEQRRTLDQISAKLS